MWPPIKINPWLTRTVVGLTLFIYFTVIALGRLDPDFGWHLQAGNYFLSHGIPAYDIFSYTAPNFPWIDHEWLHDVLIARLFRWGGYALVGVCFGILWTAALLTAARRHRLLALLLAAAAVSPYAGIRPVVYSVLGLAILERLLEDPQRRRQWLILPLVLLWANLHGGFVIGLALLAGHWLLARRPSLTLVALGAAVTLINPYGWQIYLEIWRTITDSDLHQRIKEWASFSLPPMALLYLVLTVALWWELAGNRRRALRSWPGLMLVLALQSTRHFPLFVAASLRYLEQHLDRIGQVLAARVHGQRRLAVWSMYSVLIGLLAWNWWAIAARGAGKAEQSYPLAAVNYLSKHPCNGHIFNSYNYGGYLIWRLPGVPVYIDGRMPSWRSPQGKSYLDNYLKVLSDQSYRRSEFARYNIRCALLQSEPSGVKSMVQALAREGWRTTVADQHSRLLLAP